MVMEAPPSPQSVGREFVRQYYTLLNKAPNHLHRFYNHQSSFVHGGLDPPNRETSPVIGQKQIHQKIQQLNFHDCHAKITQVDSQATLGGGVVVQVTGELSNAGQPMRRFTQTFVLAAQSPKKYYVHNDIFRYQDEIISDEDCDPESRSEPEEEVNQECPVIQDVPQQQPVIPFFGVTAPLQPGIQPVPNLHNQAPPHVLGPQPVAAVNGAVHPDDLNILPGQVPPHVINAAQNLAPQPLPTMQPNIVAGSPPISMDDNLNNEPVEEIQPVYEAVDNEEDQQEYAGDQVSSNEPKTYANLLKSGNSPYSSPPQQQQTNPPQQQLQQQQQQQVPPQTFQAPRTTSPNSGNTGFNQNRNMNRNNGRGGMQQPRMPRQDSMRTGGRNSMNEDGGDRRRSQSTYSDVNQLFLGNLPHNATEDDLREIFVEFGPISDLRVHSKPGNKAGIPGGRMPPNYGFITFETQQGVQNCLAAKPIFFPKGDKNGTSLNVEEKKTKERQSYGGRLNNDNRDRNRDRDRDNMPRRGPNGPNRNSIGNGGAGTPAGGPNNRPNNSYNRNGPPNRGSNTYNRR
ncbi:hypothetical protein WA026_004021 [Henosepilachna vigintioctopunctata]|uniref:Rasputin n=1 Tax=Henosepilachna vigintioctopunctata TaxID=420089 RepID=A0AAW1U8C6_9CUCU